MKIGILTYYNVHNHGAMLQAYALYEVLRKHGCDVEFLKFKRNYDMLQEGLEKKYKFGLSSVKFYIDYFFKSGLGTFLYNYKKRKTLSAFQKNSLNIGARYSDFTGDGVCIGSDEVFAIDVGINPFFYGHALKKSSVFSYAGSFGSSCISDIDSAGCRELIAAGFDKMSFVGVRDLNSKNIVEETSSKQAQIVCDPVILYGYKDEQNRTSGKIKKNEKYILLYSYDKNSNSKEDIENIRSFAKSKGLKVYSVGYYHKWCDKNINVTPFELLEYVKNASFLVTDTFHGSVLSIICKTQFCARVRTNANKLGFLLAEYELEDRKVKDYSELDDMFDKKIDFDLVERIVEQRREQSEKFLLECIGEM